MENERPTGDWTEDAAARLDGADEEDAERRLEVLEDLNEKLEGELDLDRPRPAGGAQETSEVGEAQPPGR